MIKRERRREGELMFSAREWDVVVIELSVSMKGMRRGISVLERPSKFISLTAGLMETFVITDMLFEQDEIKKNLMMRHENADDKFIFLSRRAGLAAQERKSNLHQ